MSRYTNADGDARCTGSRINPPVWQPTLSVDSLCRTHHLCSLLLIDRSIATKLTQLFSLATSIAFLEDCSTTTPSIYLGKEQVTELTGHFGGQVHLQKLWGTGINYRS